MEHDSLGRRKLTKQDYFAIFREAEKTGNASAACRKYEMSQPHYYQLKRKYWNEYLDTKSKETTQYTGWGRMILDQEQMTTTNESRATDLLNKCFHIIDQKLSNELLPVKEIIQILSVLAPYTMRTKTSGGDTPTTFRNLAQHHTYVTNILNQQTLQQNGK